MPPNYRMLLVLFPVKTSYFFHLSQYLSWIEGSPPKRNAEGSTPSWDAIYTVASRFGWFAAVFCCSFYLHHNDCPRQIYAPHDVYLPIGLERFSEIC